MACRFRKKLGLSEDHLRRFSGDGWALKGSSWEEKQKNSGSRAVVRLCLVMTKIG